MIYLTIVVLVILAVMIVHKKRCVKFNERFPAIDGDEFVHRCGPGVDPNTALRARRIVSEQLGIEYQRIYTGNRGLFMTWAAIEPFRVAVRLPS